MWLIVDRHRKFYIGSSTIGSSRKNPLKKTIDDTVEDPGTDMPTTRQHMVEEGLEKGGETNRDEQMSDGMTEVE